MRGKKEGVSRGWKDHQGSLFVLHSWLPGCGLNTCSHGARNAGQHQIYWCFYSILFYFIFILFIFYAYVPGASCYQVFSSAVQTFDVTLNQV